MESSEILSSGSTGKALRVWIEKVMDLAVLSGVIILPAGLLFALFQFNLGALEWGLIGLALAALGGLGAYARLIAPFNLRIKRLEVGRLEIGRVAWRLSAERPESPISNLQSQSVVERPLKVIFFSDLHVGRVKQAGWARKVVELVNAQQPDVVLIGGDFVGHVDPRALPEMLKPLGDLQASLGVFAVFGNHDYGLPGDDYSVQLKGLFRQLNIRLLQNECVTLDGRLQIVGIDELWGGYSDVKRAFGAHGVDGGHAADACRIVVGHNPDLMASIDQTAALFIFGHTHGGQIYLPFITRFFVPVDGNLYRGEYHLPQGRVYISSGCGETTTPTRLGTQVEIVEITVR